MGTGPLWLLGCGGGLGNSVGSGRSEQCVCVCGGTISIEKLSGSGPGWQGWNLLPSLHMCGLLT